MTMFTFIPVFHFFSNSVPTLCHVTNSCTVFVFELLRAKTGL